MERDLTLETLDIKHWPKVREIYAEGIATGNATFETETPDYEQWNSRHLPHSRLVATIASEVVGFAALSPVSSRECYRGVAEVSVYVAGSARGSGIGSHLLQALVQESEQHGIWTLQASIFAENRASIRLHEKCGFRIVGKRERIAKLRGVWRDTVLMERRSQYQ